MNRRKERTECSTCGRVNAVCDWASVSGSGCDDEPAPEESPGVDLNMVGAAGWFS